jgi:hypothetical protein
MSNAKTLYNILRLLILSTVNQKHENSIFIHLDILKQYCILAKQNEIIELCWIPGHIGTCTFIYGNTRADKAAKDALKFDIAYFQIPYTDLKSFIIQYASSLWQICWDF